MSDVDRVDHGLEGDEHLARLEERAEMLATSANGVQDASVAQGIAGAIKNLINQIRSSSPRAGSAIARIEDAAQRAESATSDAEDGASEEEAPLSAGRMRSGSFQKELFNKFGTPAEQQFMKTLKNGPAEYRMATINADGSISETDKVISKEQAQEDFTRIKYHSLPEEQQGQLRESGMKPAAQMNAEEETQELSKLRDSLDNMEGYKAQDMMRSGASKADALRVHEGFEKARDQVDQLRGRIMRREELRTDGRDQEANMENAMIEVDRGRLRNTLKKDVIDDAILGKGAENKAQQISGMKDVDDGQSAQLVVSAGAYGDVAQKQGETVRR
ncbi:MAG: hypothetical protein AB7L92_01645 [Alphaproteobacteria bacterium]